MKVSSPQKQLKINPNQDEAGAEGKRSTITLPKIQPNPFPNKPKGSPSRLEPLEVVLITSIVVGLSLPFYLLFFNREIYWRFS
jgi:hypothetical protein